MSEASNPSARPDIEKLQRAPWLINESAQKVFSILEDGGFVARAVGGCIRNTLLGVDVADVDIATTAPPEQVLELATIASLGAHPTGLAHGTVTLVSQGIPYEVTTLRRDVETMGRRAVVAFTDDWKEDAGRRDFTMNALYCDRNGNLFDPLDGFEDLAERRVRFIGDARMRIQEDFLRILRFFRFHASYGRGPIDEAGLAACIAELDGIDTLSAERLRVEILRILLTPGAVEAIDYMLRSGVFERIVPLADISENAVLVFSRLIEIETRISIAPCPIRRLAGLISRGNDVARRVAERLRLSNAEAEKLSGAKSALSGATRAVYDQPSQLRALIYRCGRVAVEDALLLAWATSGASHDDPAFLKAIALTTTWSPPRLPFKGADLLNMGIAAGPRVGETLRAFEDWWVAADFPSDQGVLRARLKTIVQQTEPG